MAICHGEDGLFRDAAALWDGARDHGLKKGVTQCLTLPNHAQGFLSVSANNRLPGSYPDDELEMRLRMLTELSLLALLRLEDEMVMPPEMKFSRRELEILKWTAEGKTSAEVAMILSISENTGEFPPEEYATEIQCAEQNADSLLRGGDRVNLRAPVVLRARRDTGCQGYFQPVQDY
ncbi:Regulatory activator SdiA [Klebsiella variicola]|nr:Regulatory activator SdiA [Klebsiella variicola]